MQNYKYTFNFNVSEDRKEHLEKLKKKFYENNTSSNLVTYTKMNGDRHTFNFNVSEDKREHLKKLKKKFYK